MLTIRAMSDGKGYADKHLVHSDYYDENNRVTGQWFGKGAEQLGLSGDVQSADFEAIRECRDPNTGEFLRVRQSADRNAADGSIQSKGRNLFDFTVSAPKSVSEVAELADDPRLRAAHGKAVKEMLAELENCAGVEVQQGGVKETRATGNLVVACYEHDTSRQLDPQLHTHCVAANMSYDAEEDRWKALYSPGLYQRRAYLTEVYRNALAREVISLGYRIENRHDEKGNDLGFEIVGVSPELRDKYSQRSMEKREAIAEFIRERGKVPSNDEITVLVRATRDEKLIAISTEEKKTRQRERLAPGEGETLYRLRDESLARQGPAEKRQAEPSLDYATEHVFERVSVARDFDVLTVALQHGRGKIDAQELKGAMGAREAADKIIRHGVNIATRESLDRETKLIGLVNRGLGAYEKLGGVENHFEASLECTEEQRAAVAFVLNSKDLAVNLRGAAGTGKTYTLKQIKYGLHSAGIEVVAVAPTQSAVEQLQREGFADAVNTSTFLLDEKAHANLAGKVIILDEAGMVSGRHMLALLELAEKQGARILFSGDTRQLQAVEACDSLRVLEDESMLKTIELKSVQRQKGAYREAVELLREAPVQGFFRLEKMGAIQEVPFLERPQAAANAYREAIAQKNGKGKERSVLLVCPTHAEIERVTEAIRADRKERGELGKSEAMERLTPLNWTEAQKTETRHFEPGQVLVFHKSGRKKARKNEAFTVLRTEGSKIITQAADGTERAFTGKQAQAFGVFARESIEVAAGDKLQLQSNRKAWFGFKATNGELVTVSRVDDRGRIHLADGRIMPEDYRQFAHGYAVTAHHSQGKTVDSVIITGDAMSKELFYVAASRGRESVTVLTSDIDALRESVCRSGQRLSASELARNAAIENYMEQSTVVPEKTVGETIIEGLQARGVEALRSGAALLVRAVFAFIGMDSSVGKAHGRTVAQTIPLEDPAPVLERQGR